MADAFLEVGLSEDKGPSNPMVYHHFSLKDIKRGTIFRCAQVLIWYKKKTDENKQNCQGRLATGKGTLFVVFQGRIDTDKYNTSLNINPLFGFLWDVVFFFPPTGKLGYNLLGQFWFISLSNEVEWSFVATNSYPSTKKRKSAAPRPIQIKDLQPMCEMHEISSSDTALMAPPPEELEPF